MNRWIKTPVFDFSWLKWGGLFVLVCLLLAARFPDPILRPLTFSNEEGAVYFQDAYNLPFWQAVFTRYGGYVNIVPRLLAGMCTALPYHVVPFAYSFLSLLVAGAVFSFFYLPSFARIVPQDWKRLVICIALCAAPTAQPFLRLDEVHFYLAIFLVLVSVMKLPGSLAGRSAVVLAACLSVWSAPPAAVLLPVFIYRLAKKDTSRADRIVWSIVVVAVVGYLLSAAGFNQEKRTLTFMEMADVYWHGFAYRVAAAGLAGEKVADLMVASFDWEGVLPFLALALGLCAAGLWMSKRRGQDMFPHLVFVGFICAVPLLICLRPGFAFDFTDFRPEFTYWYHDRYFFPATAILFVYLGVLWSGLAGPAKVWLNILGACWCCYLYLFGYSFHSWSERAPNFAGYSELIKQTEQASEADGKIYKLFIPIAVQPWFVSLQVGKRDDDQPSPQAVVPIQVKLTEFFDLDNDQAEQTGLKHSKWFGDFDDFKYPWVFHKVYGWMRCAEPDKGGIWFWSTEQGSFFTSPLFFPRVYNLQKNEWVTLPIPVRSPR